MSYLIDVYRGEEAQKNPLNLGLYIAFFPQLIAGPIVRYKTIAEEIRDRTISWNGFADGVAVLLKGLSKKIIFANNMAIIADKAFGGIMGQQSILFSWLGALAYALQIYFDFSGYSDMAIGLGKMFGFHFTINFDYPYAASSITDFWRRWHISLSSWFRDYVYFPLGGSKGTQAQHIRNLFVVWLLTGIWHGANWTFLVWGIAYFALLVIEKYLIRPERFQHKIALWLYRVPVLFAILICWVVFRAPTLQYAGQYILSMFGACGNPVIDNDWLFYSREYMILIILSVFLSVPFVRIVLKHLKEKINIIAFKIIRGLGYVFLMAVCVSYLVIGAHNPFIYFNF